VATFCHFFPPKKLLYLVHWLLFFFLFFSFFCGFLARIGKFVKKEKTGYSVFFWGCIPKRLAGKTFLFAALAFFSFLFYFFWAASMREFFRKKEKKKLAIGVFFGFFLFNDRFWFLQNSSNWWYPKQFFLTSRDKAPFTHGVTCSLRFKLVFWK
jgi:hypothetical protein